MGIRRRIRKSIIISFLSIGYLFGLGSFEILNFPKDSRSLSLNNSASAYNSPLLRNNPATLYVKSKKITYSFLLLPADIQIGEIQKINNIKNNMHVKKISFINYGSIIDSKTNNTHSAFDLLFEVGYKKEYENIASIGISTGYLFSSISNYQSHLFFMNLGIRSRIMKKRVGFGFSLENIPIAIDSYTKHDEMPPSIFRTAFYYKPLYVPIILNIDIKKYFNNNVIEFCGGLEFKPNKRVTIRVGSGWNILNPSKKYFSYNIFENLSVGCGFKFKTMNLDIGFMNLKSAGHVTGLSIWKNIN